MKSHPAPPLLSILIPVYNVETFLVECLESIFNQRPDFPLEILLLDDCSTDGSRVIAERYCKLHPEQARLLSHPCNRGVSAARNSLIEAAFGDYVWFLDSDDILLMPALARFYDIASKHAPDMVLYDFCKNDGGQVACFDGASGVLSSDREALIRGAFSVRKLHSWSRISRRRLWGTDLRFPVGKLFEDITISPQLMLRARTYYHAPDCWVHYRQRPGSILSSVMKSRRFDQAGSDDYANALSGFIPLMQSELGKISDLTYFAIAHFQAKIFRQICFRILQIWGKRGAVDSMRHLMGHYRRLTESASPWTLDRLARAYIERRDYASWAFLKLFLALAKSGDRPNSENPPS